MAVETTSRPSAASSTIPAPAQQRRPAGNTHQVVPPRPPSHQVLAADAVALTVASGLAAAEPSFALLAPAVVAAGLRLADLYRQPTAPSALDELSLVAMGTGSAGLLTAAFAGATTAFALTYVVAATLLVVASRSVLYALTRRFVARNPRRVLMVGTGAAGQDFADRLLAHPEFGLVPVGFVDDAPAPVDPTLPIGPVGTLADLPDLIHRLQVDRVIVDLGAVAEGEVLEVLDQAARIGVEITVLPHLAQHLSTALRVEGLAGSTLLTYRPSRHKGLGWACKRAVDVVGALLLLLFAAPLLATVALAIKLTSPGPVLFRQERVGRFGEGFQIFKFRSMVTDAEARLTEILERNEADGPYFKVEDDPRVTPIGRIIRKLSIDELPQLLNVVRGEMSLVGPRPALPQEVAQYPGWFLRRLNVPPGLTGLWQVSGRYLLPFGESTRLDVFYVDHWSLGLDLKILARTPHVVLTGKGAK